MKYLFYLLMTVTVFVTGFISGYFGGIYGINEMRVQECLIVEHKLQQYVYLHLDLSVPVAQRKVYFPNSLDDLGPVYGKLFGFYSYEINKDKFMYEPCQNNQRYVLEVGMAYGKKYISPRSL